MTASPPRVLPECMRLIGFAGGVLEFAPDLVAAVQERVGQTIERPFETFCRMEVVCAIWLGDDLGSKNGLRIGQLHPRLRVRRQLHDHD
jgi:hypothetical protein